MFRSRAFNRNSFSPNSSEDTFAENLRILKRLAFRGARALAVLGCGAASLYAARKKKARAAPPFEGAPPRAACLPPSARGVGAGEGATNGKTRNSTKTETARKLRLALQRARVTNEKS